MSKNKNTSKEVKSKVPFNVFRKGAMALAVAGVMCATPLMLTGCTGEKGEVGPQGPAGSTWYSGIEYSADQGRVGDFFYDTDDCNIYQKTASGWTLISSIKGDTGIAKEVLIQATTDYIQWKYEGETNWKNLVSLTALKGADGEDAVAPTVTIANGVWVINGVPTEHVAVATNGKTPYIKGGNWWIGDDDLEIKAEGADGEDGNDGKSAYELAYALDNTIGSEEEWIESLKGKDGREVVFNVSTTHIQWKYSGEENFKDLISLESLKGLKGEDGKSAYEIAKDGGFEGSEAEWLASLKGEKGDKGDKGDQGEKGDKGDQGDKGETGKGIVGVDFVYEYDPTTGQLYSVLTITYTEGEPEVIRTAVPKRVVSLDGISIADGYISLNRFAKVESSEEAPTLYLNVRFDDDTTGKVLLTEDMFTVGQYGYEIPDFTETGYYNYEIKYMGKNLCGSIEIVDLSNYSGYTVKGMNLSAYQVTTTYNKANLVVDIQYELDNGGEYPEQINIVAPLSAVAESYYSYDTDEVSSELDLSKVGTYQITLKSEFAFKYNPEDEENATLHLTVYDESCTIQSISTTNNIVLEFGDVDFETKLRAETFEGYLYKENDKGEMSFQGTVGDLTYDLTNFDINRIGDQFIPYTYQLEGETGVYSDSIRVSVEADLGAEGVEVVANYVVDSGDMKMMMFTQSIGENVTLYNNGIAVIDYAQFAYDMSELENNVLKLYDPYINTYTYYVINTEAGTIGYYSQEGEPTNYTCKTQIMGEMFDITVSIYGSEGTCKGEISVLMSKEMTGMEEDMVIPYGFIDCVWEDEDTISAIGKVFTVTEGNVLVEVVE